MRRRTYTPRLPGVALQSRTPVRSRYAEYSSARDAGVAPCQILAIGVPRSEPIELGDRALIMNVSRVQGRFGLEQQDMRLFVGDREVLDAMRDDRKLPGPSTSSLSFNLSRSRPFTTRKSSSSRS